MINLQQKKAKQWSEAEYVERKFMINEHDGISWSEDNVLHKDCHGVYTTVDIYQTH